MNDHKSVVVLKLPHCDFSWEEAGKTLCRDDGEAHYDGKTIFGSWAFMCEQHFSAYGVGLGLGRGQKLVVQTDKFGRKWPYPSSELCPACGQPDSVGDCNHSKLSDDEVKQILR